MTKQGIGHQNQKRVKQTSFFKSNSADRLSHGGSLRSKRSGRGQRPLSSKESLHLVFKINAKRLRHRSLRASQNFALVHQIVKIYAKHFAVKIEQISIQNDHLHALIRTSRRSQFHHFFRVVAGQIAQQFQKEGLLSCCGVPDDGGVTDTLVHIHAKGTSLWKYRPFTRVVRGWKAYQIVRNYIQLNEKEVRGEIRYQKQRLKGLSSSDWQILWA